MINSLTLEKNPTNFTLHNMHYIKLILNLFVCTYLHNSYYSPSFFFGRVYFLDNWAEK